MPVSLRVSIDGDVAIDRILSDWVRRIDDWKPAWKAIVRDFSETSRRQWSGGGSVDGLPSWKPLAASTLRQKRRLGYPPDILVRTGRLRLAHVRPLAQVQSLSLLIRIDVPYAGFHQSRRPRKRLPRRPTIQLDENDPQAERWLRILAKHAEPRKP